MDRIHIHLEKCTNCGTCRIRCPACFTEVNGRTAVRDGGERCIACGHCIALCPSSALKHRDPATNAVEEFGESPCSTISFESLVKKRRSHRHFDDRAVPDWVLQHVLDIARFSPTGVNARPVSVKIFRSEKNIRALSGLAVGFFSRLIESLDRRAAEYSQRNEPLPADLSLEIARNGRYRKMAASFEKGYDPIFHKAKAVFVFHAPKAAPTPVDDCIIAAQTAVLAAETMGLGTCYIGLFNRAWENDAALQSALHLPEGNGVFSTLILGYPALRFLRVPARADFNIDWD